MVTAAAVAQRPRERRGALSALDREKQEIAVGTPAGRFFDSVKREYLEERKAVHDG